MTQAQQLHDINPGAMRPYADNCLIELEPIQERKTEGGVIVPGTKPKGSGTRAARVLAVGPGHHGRPSFKHPEGAFIPTTVQCGQRVLVDALAGDDWSWELSSPRHNPKGAEFVKTGEARATYRCVREGEILGVLEEGAVVE